MLTAIRAHAVNVKPRHLATYYYSNSCHVDWVLIYFYQYNTIMCTYHYCIAERFGGWKSLWQIYSYECLARKSLTVHANSTTYVCITECFFH